MGDKPVEPDRIYMVSIVDFLAMGGSGLSVFQKGKNPDDMGNFREAIIDYIDKKSPFFCKVEGRQTVIKN
ncbi:MAG: hypothetical protein ABRQ39_27750 [Candidatus Eremiobacterota bacterium]